jgi:hypothetical protein
MVIITTDWHHSSARLFASWSVASQSRQSSSPASAGCAGWRRATRNFDVEIRTWHSARDTLYDAPLCGGASRYLVMVAIRRCSSSSQATVSYLSSFQTAARFCTCFWHRSSRFWHRKPSSLNCLSVSEGYHLYRVEGECYIDHVTSRFGS